MFQKTKRPSLNLSYVMLYEHPNETFCTTVSLERKHFTLHVYDPNFFRKECSLHFVTSELALDPDQYQPQTQVE